MALLPGTPTAVQITTIGEVPRTIKAGAGTLVFECHQPSRSFISYNAERVELSRYQVQLPRAVDSTNPGDRVGVEQDIHFVDCAFDSTTSVLYMIGFNIDLLGPRRPVAQDPVLSLYRIPVNQDGTFVGEKFARIYSFGVSLFRPVRPLWTFMAANHSHVWGSSFGAGSVDIAVDDDLERAPTFNSGGAAFDLRTDTLAFDVPRNDRVNVGALTPVEYSLDFARREGNTYDNVLHPRHALWNSTDSRRVPLALDPDAVAGGQYIDLGVRPRVKGNSEGYLGFVAAADSASGTGVWQDVSTLTRPPVSVFTLADHMDIFCISEPGRNDVIPTRALAYEAHVELAGVILTPEERTYDKDGELLSVSRAVAEATVIMRFDELPDGFFSTAEKTTFDYLGTTYTLSSLSYDHAEGFVVAQFTF